MTGFAPFLPPCRTLVLGNGAPAEALAETVNRLLADRALVEQIDVFGATPERLPDSRRVRWHAAAADLLQALRSLQSSLRAETDGGRDGVATADVAWIVAGTWAPAGWQTMLQRLLHAEPAIGTASPLCINDNLYSPLQRSRGRTADPAALARWLQVNVALSPVEQPVPLRWCGALRADAVSALLAAPPRAGEDGSEADWAGAVTRTGFLHVACPATVVRAPEDGARTAAAQREPPDSSLLASRQLWGSADSLAWLRLRVAEAMPEILEESATVETGATAVRLHVAHSWGGGLSTWIGDFCAADRSGVNLVLRSVGVIGAYGQRLALYSSDDGVRPLRFWELALPIHATAISHLQYRNVLREIIAEFGVNSIIVSSLIGHSLDVLRTGLLTVAVAHDLYPFCVAIFGHFDGECMRCGADRLAQCIERNAGHRFFDGVRAGDWEALRHAFLDEVNTRRIPLVAPSQSTAQRWATLMPELDRARISVIPHGIALPPAVDFDTPEGGPLRLLKVGRLSAEKGGELLKPMLTELTRFAHITLLGCGEDAIRFAHLPGVTAIAHFNRQELPALIAEIRPHLGLQLSTVAETFSYTLTEMWHCGVPVLACRLGSLAERVEEGVNGFLIEPTREALYARVKELAARRDDLARMRRRLLQTRQRTTAEMVEDYFRLLPALVGDAPPPAVDQEREPPTALPAMAAAPVRILSVDPQVRYMEALRAFARYTLGKAAHSPRLPSFLRGAFIALDRRMAR
jgi:glycosyltransferase involved in cell wall biosynthesis